MPSPPQNNSSTIFSRQLHPLRQQVETIDRKILQLLRQRTKLSTRIGELKRRQGAEIYVPEREQELLHRFTRAGVSPLPAGAVLAVYREVLSSSRAAQGQPPIGLLSAPAGRLSLVHAARERFGGSDRWHLEPAWPELAARLLAKELALVVLASGDLNRLLASPAALQLFTAPLEISDELSLSTAAPQSWEDLAFVVTLRRVPRKAAIDRFLLLIKCNSPLITVKTFVETMPTFRVFESSVPPSSRSHPRMPLRQIFSVQLTRALTPASLQRHLARALPAEAAPILLGAYAGTDSHAGA